MKLSYIRRLINKRQIWLESRAYPAKSLILVYHRVGISPKNESFDPLTVSPENFNDHLRIIKKNYTALSLSDFTTKVLNKELPEKSLILTFDDGYINNLTIVKNLLEKFEIPACFFLTSGFFGSYFWWDITSQFLKTENKQISVNGINIRFIKNSKERLKVLDKLISEINSKDYEKRIELINQIKSLDLKFSNDDLYRCMTKEETADFSRSRFVEIGGHTANHLQLASLDEKFQVKEILNNRCTLEEIIQKEVTLFAYPHGNYSDMTVNILKKNKFRCAVTGNWGINHPASDIFRLNRISVKNWSGGMFEKIIKHWL